MKMTIHAPPLTKASNPQGRHSTYPNVVILDSVLSSPESQYYPLVSGPPVPDSTDFPKAHIPQGRHSGLGFIESRISVLSAPSVGILSPIPTDFLDTPSIIKGG